MDGYYSYYNWEKRVLLLNMVNIGKFLQYGKFTSKIAQIWCQVLKDCCNFFSILSNLCC